MKQKFTEDVIYSSNLKKILKVPANESVIQYNENSYGVLLRVDLPIGIVDVKNANERIYAKEDVTKAFSDIRPLMENGGLMGFANHPKDEEEGDLTRLTHYQRDAYIDENKIQRGVFDIIDTRAGRDLAVALKTGTVGLSTRGYGELVEGYIRDYEYEGTDFVHLPSAGVYGNATHIIKDNIEPQKESVKKLSFNPTIISESIKQENKNINGENKMKGIELKKYRVTIKSLIKEALTNSNPVVKLNELKSLKESLISDISEKKEEGLTDLVNTLSEKINSVENSISSILKEAEEKKKDDTEKDKSKKDEEKPSDDTKKDDEKKKDDTEATDKKDDEKKKDDTKKDDEKKKTDTKESEKKDNTEEDDKNDNEDAEEEAGETADEEADEESEEDNDETRLKKIEKKLENFNILQDHVLQSNKVLDNMFQEMWDLIKYTKKLENQVISENKMINNFSEKTLKIIDYSKYLETNILKMKKNQKIKENRITKRKEEKKLVEFKKDRYSDPTVLDYANSSIAEYPQLESFRTEIEQSDSIKEAENRVIKYLNNFKNSSSLVEAVKPIDSNYRIDLPNKSFTAQTKYAEKVRNKSNTEDNKFIKAKLESSFGSNFV